MKKFILLSVIALGLVFTSCATPGGLVGPGGENPPKSTQSVAVNPSTGLHDGR